MKPKAYLVSIGALPPGSENARGRMSAASIALCEKGAAEGVQIDGFAVSSKPTAASAPVQVERVRVTNEKVIEEIAPYRFNFDTHEVWETRNGKRVQRSLKEVCTNVGCGVSLVQCYCTTPRIVGFGGSESVPVEIVRL